MNHFELAEGTLERARVIFGEIEEAMAMVSADQPREEGRIPRVAASVLYAAAQRNTGDIGDAARAVLDGNRAARTFYRKTLAETASAALSEARAASSGGYPARHGEGCVVRVEKSRAEPDQYFVIVEMARSRATASLVVCDHEDRCRWFPLPPVRNGVSQIIAVDDSDLLRMIGDPASKIFLR